MIAPFLACRNISVKWSDRRVLHDITFELPKGKRLVIAGETGSGKSSLLKIIGGLLQPLTGSIVLEGRRIEGPDEKLVPGHNTIAYLSQQFELPRFLRVEQIFSYANTLTGESADSLYKLCQVDHLLQRNTDELSGGEKQRIALARLLTTSPTLLLLDEPFAHLDMDHKNTLKQVVADVSNALDMTCIMVSHNPEDTLPWADHVIVLRAGSIIQQGSPRQIYLEPDDEYVAGLFGNYSSMDIAGESLLLRPEQVRIFTDNSGTVGGKVIDVLFFGSYSLAQIETDTGDLVLATISPGQSISKDQKVTVSWDADAYKKPTN